MKKLSFCVALLVGLILVGCQPDADKSMTKQEEDNMRKPLGQPMPPEAAAAMQKANAGPPPGAQAPR